MTTTDNSTNANIDPFGGCPCCKGNDGFSNIGPDHWFTCDTHRVKWCIGSNWFRCWREETEAEWTATALRLADYQEVEPVFS